MPKTIVMSLGGSLIAPNTVDVTFLKKFKKLILNFTKKGNRVLIICGGGDTCRHYQRAGKIVSPQMTHQDLDWVGISATKLNAELVRAIFGTVAYGKVILDPRKKTSTSKKILIGAGHEPGSSSDLDAVLIAKVYHADTVINLSNITYVYDKDPSKFKDAKPQKTMSWSAFRKLVGNTWVPGAHVPFDPVGARLAQKLGLQLVVMNGSDLTNLNLFLTGKPFKGTVVK